MRYVSLFYTTAMLTLSALPMAANAQTGSEGNAAAAADEIIVTARRSEESLQTVPVAVTALNEDALNKGGGFSPLDLGQLAPGIRTTGNIGNRSDVVYSIRGQSITFGNLFPSVIPYFAEVPIVGEFSTGSFFDLENVQILRGPQGVRFGRVTDGGAVLLQPRRPSNEFEGFLDVSAGNYGLLRTTGAVNIPVIEDRILLRVAGERNRRNGFTTNLLDGQKLDDVNYDSIRGSLVISPVEGLQNTTIAQYNTASETNSNQIAFVRPENYTPGPRLTAIQNALATAKARGPRYVENGNPGWGRNYGIFNDREQTIISNKTVLDITDDIRLSNIFGYIHTKKYTGFDYDGTPWSRVDSIFPAAPRLNLRSLSNETQVSGNSFNKLLNWSIGVYFDGHKNLRQEGATGFSTATDNSILSYSSNVNLFDASSKAVYGNIELDLGTIGAAGLKLMGGLRYTEDKLTARIRSNTISKAVGDSAAYPSGRCTTAYPCQTFQTNSDVVTYELGASYEVNDDVFTYVTFRKGYRPGGINIYITSVDPTGRYEPETNQEIEAGLKLSGNFAGGRYRANFAAFYDDYKNLQKRTNYQDPVTGVFVTSILNATDATIKGIEFEGALKTGGFDFGVNAAYTDAKFKRGGLTDAQLFNATNGACNFNATVNVGFCPLNRFAATPEFQTTVTAGYTVPVGDGDVRLGFDVYHQSSMAYNDNSALAIDVIGPAYTLVNGQLTWRKVGGENLDLTFFVTNLFDKEYIQGVASSSQRASTGTGARVWGPPRMFGVSGRIEFGN